MKWHKGVKFLAPFVIYYQTGIDKARISLKQKFTGYETRR